MKNIYDILDYTDDFMQEFVQDVIGVYDLWQISPLHILKKVLVSGTSDDVGVFTDFISSHLEKEKPFPLLITVGLRTVSGNNMLQNSKNYYKIKFDTYKGKEINTTLLMGMNGQAFSNEGESMNPYFPGYRGMRSGRGLAGMDMTTLQGLIDKNVEDATRTIEAKYRELDARREADSLKRMAELENKIELYKIDTQRRELEEKKRSWEEQQQTDQEFLREELERLESKKAQSLGTISDWVYAAGSGLYPLIKEKLGFEERENPVKNDHSSSENEEQHKEEKVNLSGLSDSGFEEIQEEENTDNEHQYDDTQADENEQLEFEKHLQYFMGLSEDRKVQVLEALSQFDDDQIEETADELSDTQDLSNVPETEKIPAKQSVAETELADEISDSVDGKDTETEPPP